MMETNRGDLPAGLLSYRWTTVNFRHDQWWTFRVCPQFHSLQQCCSKHFCSCIFVPLSQHIWKGIFQMWNCWKEVWVDLKFAGFNKWRQRTTSPLGQPTQGEALPSVPSREPEEVLSRTGLGESWVSSAFLEWKPHRRYFFFYSKWQ